MHRRLLVTGLVILCHLIPLAAAAGTTTTTGGGETTTTAVVIEPAVPVTEAPEVEEQLDWTYRYFIPTLLVLAALVVVVTVVQYFVMVVRKRYRVVR
jgi:hypothetical protein